MFKFLFVAFIMGFSSTAALADVKITRNISYGSDKLQALDVYQPDQCVTKTCPVVMWVHGGGWRTGDAGRATDMLTAWANQGIVMVGVNYRLSPKDKHPAHVEDIASSIHWVRTNIQNHGGIPSNVSLLGHSAGAHLVALVATNPRFLAAHNLTLKGALVNVFPIDTASFDLTNPSRFVDHLILQAFGTDPDVLKDASPIKQVTSNGQYPSFIIAATKNRPDAVKTTLELERKLKEAKTNVSTMIINYPGMSQAEAHGAIAKDLGNVNNPMTKSLIDRVLLRSSTSPSVPPRRR